MIRDPNVTLSCKIDLSGLNEHQLLLNIGAMKAGTTWLYVNLYRHPEMAFPEEKEPQFFSDIFGHTQHLTANNRLEIAKRIFNKRVKSDIYYAKYYSQ